MSTPPTARDYLAIHRVDISCSSCGYLRRLDLAWLIAGGLGDTSLVDLPLRCTSCGAIDFKVTVNDQAMDAAKRF